MIEAITFDLDMTLIDFWHFKQKASDAAAKAMVLAGLTMTVKQCQKELFDHYIPNIEGNQVLGDFLKTKKQCTNRILAAGINAYLKEKYSHLRAFPGVARTLRKLKNKYKLAVVSDAPKLKAYMRLDAIGLADFFDVVVAHDDTGTWKPSYKPFLFALKKLQVKPQFALHVGDWPMKDIRGARKLGMKTCLANYGNSARFNSGPFVKPDYAVNNFEDILKVIKKIEKS